MIVFLTFFDFFSFLTSSIGGSFFGVIVFSKGKCSLESLVLLMHQFSVSLCIVEIHHTCVYLFRD